MNFRAGTTPIYYPPTTPTAPKVYKATVTKSEMNLTQFFVRYQDKDFAETSPPPVRQEIRDANNWMGGFLHLLRGFNCNKHPLAHNYTVSQTRQTKNSPRAGERWLAIRSSVLGAKDGAVART